LSSHICIENQSKKRKEISHLLILTWASKSKRSLFIEDQKLHFFISILVAKNTFTIIITYCHTFAHIVMQKEQVLTENCYFWIHFRTFQHVLHTFSTFGILCHVFWKKTLINCCLVANVDILFGYLLSKSGSPVYTDIDWSTSSFR